MIIIVIINQKLSTKSLLLLLTRIYQPEQTRNYQQEITNQKYLQEYQQINLYYQ